MSRIRQQQNILRRLFSFLLPFTGFVSIACVLAAGDGTRPFWNFVPKFLWDLGEFVVILITWGYVPTPFPVLFLSAFSSGYLAGRVNRDNSKHLPYASFLAGSAAILGSIAHNERTWYWPIAAALSFLPFVLGKSKGDWRRAQEWKPDCFEVPSVLPFYPLIYVGLSTIYSSLSSHGNILIRLLVAFIGLVILSLGKAYRDRLFQRYRDRYAKSVCEKRSLSTRMRHAVREFREHLLGRRAY